MPPISSACVGLIRVGEARRGYPMIGAAETGSDLVGSRAGAVAVGSGSSCCRQLSLCAGASICAVAPFPVPVCKRQESYHRVFLFQGLNSCGSGRRFKPPTGTVRKLRRQPERPRPFLHRIATCANSHCHPTLPTIHIEVTDLISKLSPGQRRG